MVSLGAQGSEHGTRDVDATLGVQGFGVWGSVFQGR